MATQLYICTSKIRSANQLSENRSSNMEGILYCPLWLPLVVGNLLQEGMYSCKPWDYEQKTGDCYHAKNWNWPKLTITYWPRLPLESARLWKLQSSKIVTSVRFCQCNSCLSDEMDSRCLYSKNFPEFFLSMVLWFLFA